MIQPQNSEKERLNYIKNGVLNICEALGYQAEAIHLPTISENVTFEEFSQQFSRGRFPIGYSKKDPASQARQHQTKRCQNQ
jgi:hypothetical protein